MTKKLSFIGALLSLVGATLFPAGAAQAAFAPWLPDPIVYTVGDTVSFDLGCGENDVTNVYYQNGNLPDGLTMNNLGLVTGIPTTTGTFTLSGYHCSYNGGSYAGYFPSASVTFQINPLSTPTPILVAHSLNTEDCSFYVGMLFTVLPDVGTVYIEASNQAGTVLHSVPSGQFSANQMREGAITIADLNSEANSPNFVGSLTGNEPFRCGDSISITVGYQFGGAPVATQTITGFIVDKPSELPVTGGAPIQKLIPLNNDACEFKVFAALPTAPMPGSTKITISSYHPEGTVDHLTYTIADNVAGGLMDFTFNPTDLSSGPSLPAFWFELQDYQVSTSWACGSTLYVSVEYRDLWDNYFSSMWYPWLQTNGFAVTPTKPEVIDNPEISITAEQSNVGTCNISVAAHVADTYGLITIGITDTDSNDWITSVVIHTGDSADGVVTVNLSFTSIDAIFANVPIEDENKTLNGTPVCLGTYRALIDSPVGMLASTTFTLGQNMPTCNAGSILDEEQYRCTEVERGFFTTELNSSTPIACPAGMTTATTASKSVNDCYKPIVQSIAAFKAPKALKLKGTTYLAIATNNKTLASYTVGGLCKAKLANVVTKVKGKKVTTKMLKVTAGKKAGICSITLTSPTSGKYLALSKVVQIKVSKSGK